MGKKLIAVNEKEAVITAWSLNFENAVKVNDSWNLAAEVNGSWNLAIVENENYAEVLNAAIAVGSYTSFIVIATFTFVSFVAPVVQPLIFYQLMGSKNLCHQAGWYRDHLNLGEPLPFLQLLLPDF